MSLHDVESYIIDKQQNAPGAVNNDMDTWSRVSREWSTLSEGTVRGLMPALKAKVDNPGCTLLEIAGAAGIGLLLSRAQVGAGFGRLAAEGIGLGLSYSFAKHATGQFIPFSQALSSSWDSGKDLEKNKDIVGATLAPFLVDSALTIVPAVGAARWGMGAELRQLGGRLGAESRNSVFKVRTINGVGSSFLLDSEGTLGTAYHVASSSIANKLQIHTENGVVSAKAIAALPYEDVALLKAHGPLPGRPLALADDTSAFPLRGGREAPVPGAALGFPRGGAFSARPGGFSNFHPDETFSLAGKPVLDRTLFGARTEPGMSGGPVVDANNKVIGVNIQGLNDILIGEDALASPVEGLAKLIGFTERAKAGGGLTIEEASIRLGITPAEVTTRLGKGKLDGFLKAEDPYDTMTVGGKKTQWSWVVVLPPGS